MRLKLFDTEKVTMEKFNKNHISRLRALVDHSSRVVITTHMTPDGDALGSSLALYHVLCNMGKDVRIVVPDRPTMQLSFLPGFKYIDVYTQNPDFATNLIHDTELLFCLDYNEPKRTDLVAKAIVDSTAHKVLIDHHLNPAQFCDITISRPKASSTCELLYQVLCALELYDAIDRNAATCLLAGMMTDTGNFNYNANNPIIYKITAHLIQKGANKDDLSKRLFDTFSQACLRINAYAIYEKMKVWEDYGAAMITLTRDELNKMGYERGDTEGLVNKPLAIPKVVYSVFLREENNYIKVSMRSKGDFPCNAVCHDHFNGGGHLNAAGGEFYGTMEEAEKIFEDLLKPNYQKYIAKR
ncbi:MAG: DHH family phosphoesterase [Bacteroidales bacterium]|nr:DHH family phosphoesterase [Bacteroidales bacterium]